ncbi:MAG: type II toxin-antitoxin system RelE/ParE family toxin [Burkholderiaceae bacterium]|nr:type II toxin-antitoxin system RelE/ParE family toxin [Burkholderiaceae bacterium]
MGPGGRAIATSGGKAWSSRSRPWLPGPVALRVVSANCTRTGERDLLAPTVNRLEQLKGDRAGQWSLRVNDQLRICFRWKGSNAEDVEIVDYLGGRTR